MEKTLQNIIVSVWCFIVLGMFAFAAHPPFYWEMLPSAFSAFTEWWLPVAVAIIHLLLMLIWMKIWGIRLRDL